MVGNYDGGQWLFSRLEPSLLCSVESDKRTTASQQSPSSMREDELCLQFAVVKSLLVNVFQQPHLDERKDTLLCIYFH